MGDRVTVALRAQMNRAVGRPQRGVGLWGFARRAGTVGAQGKFRWLKRGLTGGCGTFPSKPHG